MKVWQQKVKKKLGLVKAQLTKLIKLKMMMVILTMKTPNKADRLDPLKRLLEKKTSVTVEMRRRK